MKIPPLPHSFHITLKEATSLQREWAAKVVITKPTQSWRYVAGTDCAFSKDKQHCFSGVVIWDMKENKVLETATAVTKVRFPYVPGYLSFREAPAILAALKKIHTEPDVLMVDGQGIAHPRGFGIASHLGILTQRPTIGCAKSKLCGTYEEPSLARGMAKPLHFQNQTIGSVLRTRTGIKPLFISIGHLLDLATAKKVVLKCATQYRLPEPTRLADKLVRETRIKFANRTRNIKIVIQDSPGE
jgi:deoxyribonuclease V